MQNILNLISESTYIEKMDMQNALLRAIVSQSGGSVGNLPPINSWSVVQQLVRLGIAPKVFSVGDQLVCSHATYGTLTWDIIGIDHDTPVNSDYTHSISIQLHDCIAAATFQFDAAEPTNPDTNIASFGSNDWEISGIRQFLNSGGNAGSWWQAKSDYDVQPDYAASAAGFMKGFDADFLAVIGEVSKITAKNTSDGVIAHTTNEKFFLPSMTEVYGGLNGTIAEGVVYPYYAENSSLTTAGTGSDTNRIKYRNGNAQNWLLRSPDLPGTHQVRRGYTTGAIYHTSANNSSGLAPICCIV